MGILEELRARGVLDALTSEERFQNLRVGDGVYCGFDPTAGSLHLGNYLLIATLRRFKQAGFKIVALVGGATGRIGDPSFRSKAREVVSIETIEANTNSIGRQLGYFGFEVFDNYQIYRELDVISFLRDVGSLVNVNTMLAKESVAARLEGGLTFTEFSYQLMQGYDFCYLYRERGVRVQIGGSDQWGNITTGLTMLSKLHANPLAVGVTTKLILDSNNQKFGKSKGGALWIEPNLKNAFKCYQYLLNQGDETTYKLLSWLTFLSLEEIDRIVSEHRSNPKLRLAQRRLASQVCEDIFGAELTQEAVVVSRRLFEDGGGELSSKQLEALYGSLPTTQTTKRVLVEVLVDSKVVSSKREARELIQQGAISIDLKRVTDPQSEVNCTLLKDCCLLRVGKKDYYLVELLIGGGDE